MIRIQKKIHTVYCQICCLNKIIILPVFETKKDLIAVAVVKIIGLSIKISWLPVKISCLPVKISWLLISQQPKVNKTANSALHNQPQLPHAPPVAPPHYYPHFRSKIIRQITTVKKKPKLVKNATIAVNKVILIWLGWQKILRFWLLVIAWHSCTNWVAWIFYLS